MKVIHIFLCLILSTIAFAKQTEVTKEVPYTGATISLTFDDAEEVNVRGWDQNKVLIQAEVFINMGENDEAFVLETSASGAINVSGFIKDKDQLPQMVVIHKDDQKYYFKGGNWDSPEVQNFVSEHGRDGYDWMSHGVAREIQITVFVPRRSSVEVYSKHGIIDVEGFAGALKANSKHGGIDVSIDAANANKFEMDTQWGTIYTNLDLVYSKKQIGKEHDHWTTVEAEIGGGRGPLVAIQSKHGNLYIRKQ